MSTQHITLDIHDISRTSAMHGDTVEVFCRYIPFARDEAEARHFSVVIARNAVTVIETADDHSPVKRQPGDVLVSNTLVEATRRLFGMVR